MVQEPWAQSASLLSAAFTEVKQAAKKSSNRGGKHHSGVVLLIDEADALAQSREMGQMHHEDRVGVNALIRGIDDLATGSLPAIVVMCTNRLDALDPAVRRRAAGTLNFERPSEAQRDAFLRPVLEELEFTSAQIRSLVVATGATQGRNYGYTYSDLAQRLLPGLLLAAYPSKRITFDLAKDVVDRHPPTPPFKRAGRLRVVERIIMATSRKSSKKSHSNKAASDQKWSLAQLLAGLHDDVQQRLATARKTFGHPGTKGDASESVWLEMLRTYLPQRYQVAKAHVVDSQGNFSEQMDVVVFDRQYSPFIFNYQGQTIVPAESVYGVFEAKQSINAEQVKYAQKKVASARRLQRTSLPIPHAGGVYPPKPLTPILGGLLTFDSDWRPPLGSALINLLSASSVEGKLDLGCVAKHGMFSCDASGCHSISPQSKPATTFLFELIARLQSTATVPMIDVRAYARWLTT